MNTTNKDLGHISDARSSTNDQRVKDLAKEKLLTDSLNRSNSDNSKLETNSTTNLHSVEITDTTPAVNNRHLSAENECSIDEQVVLDTKQIGKDTNEKLDKSLRQAYPELYNKLYKPVFTGNNFDMKERDDAEGKAARKELNELKSTITTNFASQFFTGLKEGEQGKEPENDSDVHYKDGYSIGQKIKNNGGTTTDEFNNKLKEIYSADPNNYSPETAITEVKAQVYADGLEQGSETNLTPAQMSAKFRAGLEKGLTKDIPYDELMSGVTNKPYSKEPGTDAKTMAYGYGIGKYLRERTGGEPSPEVIETIIKNYEHGVEVAH